MTTTYYVSTTGSDSLNNGLTSDAPYRTLAKACSVLAPSDTLLLKGGDTFYEYLIPTVTGTSGYTVQGAPNVINIGSYGTGKARLSALRLLPNTWQVHQGDIYKLQLDSSYALAKGYNQLFSGDDPLIEGRWPKVPNFRDYKRNTCCISTYGELDTSSLSGGTYSAYYQAPELTQFPDNYWQGGSISFAPGYEWEAYSADILSNTQGTGRVDFRYPYTSALGANVYKVASDDPFYISHCLNTLMTSDAIQGEWYFELGTYVLYMKGVPSGNYYLKARSRCINLSSVSYYNVSDLDLIGGYIDTANTKTNLTLSNLTVAYPRYCNYSNTWPKEAAVQVRSSNFTFTNGIIYGCTGGAFEVTEGSVISITNNVIYDCLFSFVNRGWPIGVTPALTSNVLISQNTILYSGRGGIGVGKANTVTYNYVSEMGRLLTDVPCIGAHSVGDCLNTEVGYNISCNNVAYRNPIGSHNGGHLYRMDNGGGNGCSNYTFHHNIGWNSTSESIPIWPLTSSQVNYPNQGARFYNNTVDAGIVFLTPSSGTDSYQGIDISNNCAYKYSYGSNSNTYTTIPTGVTLLTNHFEFSFITGNQTGNPLFKDPVSRNYTPSPNSPLVGGSTLVTYPLVSYNSFIPSGHSIGAISSPSTHPFVAGAVIDPSTPLTYTSDPEVGVLSITGMPYGRFLPNSYALTVDGTSYPVFQYMQADGYVKAFMPYATGGPISVTWDGESYEPLGYTVTNPTFNYGSVSYTSPIVKVLGTGFVYPDSPITYYSYWAGSQDLYTRPILLRVNTEGMGLPPSGAGLRFQLGTEVLLYYVEPGTVGTDNTLIWLARASKEPIYAGGLISMAQDALSLPSTITQLFPNIPRATMALWLQGHDVYTNNLPINKAPGNYALDTTNPPTRGYDPSIKLNTLSFNGTNQYLKANTLPTGTNLTALVIYKNPDATGSWIRLLSSGAGTDYQGGVYVPPIQNNTTGAVTPQVNYVYHTSTSSNTLDFTNFNIGRSNISNAYFKGQVAELIVLNENTSLLTRTDLDYYLRTKYSISNQGNNAPTVSVSKVLTPVRLDIDGVQYPASVSSTGEITTEAELLPGNYQVTLYSPTGDPVTQTLSIGGRYPYRLSLFLVPNPPHDM